MSGHLGGGAAIAAANARVSLQSRKIIRFLRLWAALGLVIWLNVFVSVSRSSIRGPDEVLCEVSTRKCHFLFIEFRRTRQLMRWSRWRTTTKDKSRRLALLNHLKLNECVSGLACNFTSILLDLVRNIRILLIRGGVEINPGPDQRVEEGFLIKSQNCRGLSDRSKLFRLLKGMFPSRRGANVSPTIGCWQETHIVDSYVLDQYFKGTVVKDNGERNQRGVCTLIPDQFEVCSTSISGIGRWAIAVFRAKETK